MVGFFALGGLVAAWWAALWFLIAPGFAGWNPAALIGSHALPPLGLWAGWLAFRRHRQDKAAAAEAARQEAAAAEQAATLAEARRQHEAQLLHRQFGCDCRGLAMLQLRQPNASDTAADPVPGVASTLIDELPPAPSDESIQAALGEGLHEVVLDLYASCPAAARLPHYIVPPTNSVGEEVLALVRNTLTQVAGELRLAAATRPATVLYLPGGDSAANRVVGLFESAPDLPGVVVLAFDSPQLATPVDDFDFDELSPEQKERRKWQGQPGHGVFALLLTSPGMPELLAQHHAGAAGDDGDSMTPYWQKNFDRAAAGRLLTLTPDESDALLAAPVLGRIHRAVAVHLDDKQRSGGRALSRIVAASIGNAAINAALKDWPFESTAADADAAPAELACGWLLHNCGAVDCGGTRLAALSVGLIDAGSELDPIDAATNLVVDAGDLGEARSLGLLAMTVARVAASGQPALAVEFAGPAELSLGFVATAPEA